MVEPAKHGFQAGDRVEGYLGVSGRRLGLSAERLDHLGFEPEQIDSTPKRSRCSLNERAHFGRCGSSSPAKNALAACLTRPFTLARLWYAHGQHYNNPREPK